MPARAYTQTVRDPIRTADHVRSGRACLPLLIGLTATALVALVDWTTWPNHLELKLIDLRLKHLAQPPSHPDLVSVVIDDNSLQQVGRWPWPRRHLADLVDVCSEVNARRILLDINMPEEQPIEVQIPGVTDVSRYEAASTLPATAEPICVDNDALLAQSLTQARNVVLPFYGRPTASEKKTAEQPTQQHLTNTLEPLLRTEPDLSLADIFARLYPAKSFRDEDFLRSQLRLAYMQVRSLIYLEQSGATKPSEQTATPLSTMPALVGPLPELAQAAAATGFVNILEDKDGAVRRVPLLARHQQRIYQQLAFATLCRDMGLDDDDIELAHRGKIVLKAADITIPVTNNSQMLIAWSDNWSQLRAGSISTAQAGYVPVVTLLQLPQLRRAHADNTATLELVDSLAYQLGTVPPDTELDESTRQTVDEMRRRLALLPAPQSLKQANQQLSLQIEQTLQHLQQQLHDKIVLVGSIATSQAGAEDFAVTPISEITPGIVVHRNIINTILQRAFVQQPTRWTQIPVLLGLGLTMTLLTGYRRARVSGLAFLVLISLTVAANLVLLARSHLLLPLATPLAVLVATFASVTFYRQITEGRARRYITSRFKQYAAPAVVDRIVANADELHLAGELREVTCYFADLAGFTPTSEKLGPEKTVQVLNVYLDRMTQVLDRYDATINKFEGDGIFAFFGAPLTLTDHARRACRAALDAQKALAQLVQEQQTRDPDFPTLTMRIGISTGKVVVGNCGSARRFDYTAIGDTVNLAARLESANKAFGTANLICRHARQSAGNDQLAFRYLGSVRVVGKKMPVSLYQLLPPSPDTLPHALAATQQAHYIPLFESAVHAYQHADFAQAVHDFQTCLTHRPHDRAAQLYLHAARALQQNPNPEFAGILELTQK